MTMEPKTKLAQTVLLAGVNPKKASVSASRKGTAIDNPSIKTIVSPVRPAVFAYVGVSADAGSKKPRQRRPMYGKSALFIGKSLSGCSHHHRCLSRAMRMIVHDFEVLVLVVKDRSPFCV
jgi:hypothetical protein